MQPIFEVPFIKDLQFLTQTFFKKLEADDLQPKTKFK